MEICCMAQGTQTGLYDNQEGWDGVGEGSEAQEAGNICIPLAYPCWRNQHNIVIILQLKINKFLIKKAECVEVV